MKRLIIAVSVALVACGQADDDYHKQARLASDINTSTSESPQPEPPVNPPDRFKVARVQLVNDPLAYGGQRGVYLIIDKKTGKEFVGLSGVGISELGSHSSGKIQTTDDR